MSIFVVPFLTERFPAVLELSSTTSTTASSITQLPPATNGTKTSTTEHEKPPTKTSTTKEPPTLKRPSLRAGRMPSHTVTFGVLWKDEVLRRNCAGVLLQKGPKVTRRTKGPIVPSGHTMLVPASCFPMKEKSGLIVGVWCGAELLFPFFVYFAAPVATN